MELEEEVTRQIAHSSELEYVKLRFEEVTPCFDLPDTLVDDSAAFSTQEAQDCLDNALKLPKRKCDLLINVRKYEKVLTNDGPQGQTAYSECKAICNSECSSKKPKYY